MSQLLWQIEYAIKQVFFYEIQTFAPALLAILVAVLLAVKKFRGRKG